MLSLCFSCASVAKQKPLYQCFKATICVSNLPLISPRAEKSQFLSPCTICVLQINPLWGHKVHLHQLRDTLHCRSLVELSQIKKKTETQAKKHQAMIIMHFIVNETNNTQVFQCQHLTEQRYKKKEKIIPYKMPKALIITLRCSNCNSKTECKYSPGIKVVLAKSSWQALIRIHSCVNMAWGKTLGKKQTR